MKYKYLWIACLAWACNSEVEQPERIVKDYAVAEKNLQLNGEDHFFQGFYTNDRTMITDPEADMDFQKFKEGGFDWLYMKLEVGEDGLPAAQDLAFLDRCKENGISVLVDRFGSKTIAETAKAYGSHPAIFGYNLLDDANAHGDRQSVLTNQRQVKLYAGDKYSMVSVYQNYEGGASKPPLEFSGAADITGFQTYPIGNWAINLNPPAFTEEEVLMSVDNRLEKFQETNGPISPLVPNPQVFPWISNKDAGGNGTGLERLPTPQEYRNMTYVGVINGAKSIMNYSLHEAPAKVGEEWFEWIAYDSEPLWSEVLKVKKELDAITPMLLNGKRAKAHQDNKWITAAYWNVDGTYYMMVANLSLEESQEYNIEIPVKTATASEQPLEINGTASDDLPVISDYAMKGTIDKMEVRLYQIK